MTQHLDLTDTPVSLDGYRVMRNVLTERKKGLALALSSPVGSIRHNHIPDIQDAIRAIEAYLARCEAAGIKDTLAEWFALLPGTAVDVCEDLLDRVAEESCQNDVTIYPPTEKTLYALELTAPQDVKVVILGQDPYINPDQACGLAFSVPDGVPLPPSLRNIFTELHQDIGCPIPSSGNLKAWAQRGVLLLNTVLTVEEGKSNSHKDWGWQTFTSAVIRACGQLPQPIVFMLWGRNAQIFGQGALEDALSNKRILCSSHPSPMSVTQARGDIPAFRGSRPFSQANALLCDMGSEPIDWDLFQAHQ